MTNKVVTWDDDLLRESIPRKGQNRFNSSIKPVLKGSHIPKILECSNCEKPVSLRFEDHCRCDIWHVGLDGSLKR